MFDRIAGVYDLLNTAMTAGFTTAGANARPTRPGWARAAACWTWRRAPATWRSSWRGVSAPGGEVLGCDFAEAMLDRPAPRRGPALTRPPRFEWGDAMRCPYEDATFDAATVGFGARNFEDLGRGLSEMARVVRPGGRVVVLEITTPMRPPLSLFSGSGSTAWFRRSGGSPGDGGRRRAPGASDEVTISDAYALPAELGQALPGPRMLAGELRAGGARGDQLHPDRRRDRRDPLGHRRGSRGEPGRA